MTNKARGEVEYKVNGTKYKLCLTLGALTEIESELGIEDFTKVTERFKKPKMKDIQSILLALLHGGGHTEMTEEDLMHFPIDVKQLTEKIGEAFRASGMGSSEETSGGKK